jgi:hypothetical protein
MARMNISIPDPLYERLDRLRDRVNASKVCAQALERELDMLEGRSAVGDPEIGQLIRRLQSVHDRWYQRGREDGKRWAVTLATRDELWRVGDDYASDAPEELAVMVFHHQHGPKPWFPTSFDARAAVEEWVRRDLRDAGKRVFDPAEPSAEREASAFGIADAPELDYETARAGVDEAGYIGGWRDVVAEVWKAVAPALRR